MEAPSDETRGRPSADPGADEPEQPQPGRQPATGSSAFQTKIVPPLVAWIFARVLLMALAMLVFGHDPFESQTWSRSDSLQGYIDLAHNGYTLFDTGQTDDTGRKIWQGNAGWMPLYPWMIRFLLPTGLSDYGAGVFLSALFAFLSLVVLWNRFLVDVPRPQAMAALLIAAFFPSEIYQFAVYPISLMVFLCLIAMDQGLRGRWWLAGLAGMLASMAYSSGILLSGVFGLFIVLNRQGAKWPVVAGRLLLGAVPPALGFGLVCLIQKMSPGVGVWNGFFLVQGTYHEGWFNPLSTLWGQLSHSDVRYVKPQFVVLDVAVLVCLGWTIVGWKSASAMQRLLTIFAAVFWLFPLSQGEELNPLRPAACLLPMAALVRRLPVGVQGVILLAAVGLSYLTEQKFFMTAM